MYLLKKWSDVPHTIKLFIKKQKSILYIYSNFTQVMKYIKENVFLFCPNNRITHHSHISQQNGIAKRKHTSRCYSYLTYSHAYSKWYDDVLYAYHLINRMSSSLNVKTHSCLYPNTNVLPFRLKYLGVHIFV